MTGRSRRDFLRVAGLTLAPATLSAGKARASSGSNDRWSIVASPTERTLHGVAQTEAGPYGVGAGGVAVGRSADGWSVAVSNGPTGNGNNLSSASTTADGERLWMAGDSGVIGEYTPKTGTLTSWSAPDGVTNSFTDIAVTGSAGDASVYVCDASGQVHVSTQNGREGTWTHTTPGDGSAISAIEVTNSSGVLIDHNQSLFESSDGTTWMEMPAPEFGTTLNDITLTDSGTLVLVGDSGTVLVRKRGNWERETATGQTLEDVELGECGCVHAVGASGTVVHRMRHDSSSFRSLARWLDLWTQRTPTGQNLKAISLGPPHVAVGAGGTIIEK